MSIRTITAGVAVAAAAATSLVLAAPASAEPNPPCCAYYVSTRGALATFYPSGEVLYLSDQAADGHHVVAYYTTSNHQSSRTLTNYTGAGVTETSVNLSIPETGWISINVCVAEGSAILIRCSGYSKHLSAGNFVVGNF